MVLFYIVFYEPLLSGIASYKIVPERSFVHIFTFVRFGWTIEKSEKELSTCMKNSTSFSWFSKRAIFSSAIDENLHGS